MPRREPAAWVPRRRPGLLAGVLLAHALILLGWHAELSPRLRGLTAPARQAPLVWLQIAPQPKPVPQLVPAARAPANPPRAAEVVERRQAPTPTPTTVAAPPVPAPENLAIHLPPPEPAASAASAPQERLMDTAGTRAAIRQAGRTALLSERAAHATGQPFVGKGEQEAKAVSHAAKADCMKGEGAGGMGLLGLPILVVAAVTGHCAR